MTTHRPIVLIDGNLNQLPVGDSIVGSVSEILPQHSSIPASENISAGDFVNVYNDSGVTRVRKASGQGGDHEAHGFVLASFSETQIAEVYFEGINTSVSGVQLGPVWLSSVNPGGVQGSPAEAGGQLNQSLGIALTSSSIRFQPGIPVLLA